MPECDGVCTSLSLGVGVRLTDLVPGTLPDVDEEKLGEPEFEGDAESVAVYSCEEGLADVLGEAVDDREVALERDAEGVRDEVVVGVIVVVEDEELEYEATLDDALGEDESVKLMVWSGDEEADKEKEPEGVRTPVAEAVDEGVMVPDMDFSLLAVRALGEELCEPVDDDVPDADTVKDTETVSDGEMDGDEVELAVLEPDGVCVSMWMLLEGVADGELVDDGDC